VEWARERRNSECSGMAGVCRTFDNGFAPECKNPPEAGSLKMVPEPGQKCREHFCIARLRATQRASHRDVASESHHGHADFQSPCTKFRYVFYRI